MKTPARIIIFAGVFFFSGPARAQSADMRYGEEYQTCNTGQTQSTVECVASFTKTWDERLNAAYEKALKKLSPERRDGLRNVQRAWIAYRDANCRWYADGEGTIARVESAECMRSMTAARALELEEAIEEH